MEAMPRDPTRILRGITMSTNLRIALVRRALLASLALLVALLALSFRAEPAHAIMDPTTVTSGHVGWVLVRSTPQYCDAIYPSTCSTTGTRKVWRWGGSAWTAYTIRGGTSVYAYPYSGSFHWIWTQRTGWLAIQSADLDTGYRCTGANCPVF